ncbi:unnamed protein product [Psylliodes chrysocephalus]|uniref:Uncharacterized protein n=1 Tax=Psylliodes chrysocephalus TaxID=3402493 RepID=A0A9P0D133_9CUCU|nr:unnamed protein product [Psylliodes chrysocephala]
MFNKMFLIRFVLVSCYGLVISKNVEAECKKSVPDTLRCENVAKISCEVLNKNYENYTKLEILNTNEPFGMSAFTNMKNLTSILIMGGRIGIIYTETFKDIPHLESVIIHTVKIGDIQESVFFNLPKLKTVVITNTDIPFLRKGIFRNVPQLYLINIENANLRYIQNEPFYDVPYLKELSLYNNLLTILTKDMLYNLENLVYLDLSNNSISIVEKNTFDATPHLSKLNLEDNQLIALDLDIFPTTGMKSLQTIYLKRNQLMYLPSTFFTRTPALQEISLSHNPWFCPCLFEIHRILNLYNITEIWVKEICIEYGRNSCKKPMPYSHRRLPICINRNVSDINCTNTYSQNLSEKYLKYTKEYDEFIGNNLEVFNVT